MIHALWPTVRLEKMFSTHAEWVKNTVAHDVKYTFGVNTREEATAIQARLPQASVLVTGTERRGPVWPVYRLGQTLIAKENDIVLVVSDDFYCKRGWDEFVASRMKEKCGLMTNDGFQRREGRAMTLPLMTFGALLDLNRIIYNPAYHWEYSDNELFENLTELGLLKEARDGGPEQDFFRHHHWVAGLRGRDEHDYFCAEKSSIDKTTFAVRSKLPLAERLKYEPS